jgi:hypothetical protein
LRFEVTDRFKADVKRLRKKPEHWRMFQEAVRAFSKACDAYVADSSKPWPAELRVKPMKGAPGIWEMTWNFASPDGRATFEWIKVEVEDSRGRKKSVPAVRWRCCGTHDVFRAP